MDIAFLSGLSRDKYQDLLDDLSNLYLAGRNEYSKTVVHAYNLVTNWKVKKTAGQIKLNDSLNFNTFGE